MKEDGDTYDVVDDLQIELALASEELHRARQEVLRLQRLLISTEKRDDIWLLEEPDEFPESFAQLDDWLAYKLRYVRFLGDSTHMLALQKYDTLGRWARETWTHLTALEDYVAAKIEGAFNGDLHRYLANPPIGYRVMSAAKYAARESESVMSSPSMRNERRFPVPESHDESGFDFYFAHTKIAKHGSISPRLHLIDASSKSRAVYVGYIGRHLTIASA